MSGVLSIERVYDYTPGIVDIVTTDSLATITTTGYWLTQTAQILAVNSGAFTWQIDPVSGNSEDIALIYYSDNGGSIGFFNYVPSTGSFTAFPQSAGTLTNTLPSADIFVGNASNIATGVAMTGDVKINNVGATTIQTGAVTGSKIAANTVDYANIALDVAATATVALTAAQFKALYDTPIQVIAAPGAGQLIIVDSVLIDYAYSTAQYTAGGAIGLQYGNASNLRGPSASGTLAAATLNAVAASGYLSLSGSAGVPLNVAASASLNTAVYISNDTRDFASGSGTFNVYIKYRVVTPA